MWSGARWQADVDRCHLALRLGDQLLEGARHTWFYPGYGDDSTLGEQKPHIDEWRSRGW